MREEDDAAMAEDFVRFAARGAAFLTVDRAADRAVLDAFLRATRAPWLWANVWPGLAEGKHRKGIGPVAWASSPQIIEWEGRSCDRAEGQREQSALLIVAGDAISLEFAAGGAAVDDRPLTIAANFDCDRFHRGAADMGAIARLVVDMTRPEAAGAVVAMPRAKGLGGDVELAAGAGEV